MKRKASQNSGGFSLIELTITVAITAVLAGVAFYSLDQVNRGERNADQLNQAQSLLVGASLDIMQTGMLAGDPAAPGLARPCEPVLVGTDRVLSCTIYKYDLPVGARYRIFQSELVYEEEKAGVYEVIKRYPGVGSLTLCDYEDQAGIGGKTCALGNTALNNTTNRNAAFHRRFIRFGLSVSANRVDTATRQTTVSQSLQGAFFVRNPFLAGVKLQPGKRL